MQRIGLTPVTESTTAPPPPEASGNPAPARRYPMPFTRIEVALFGVIDGRLQVLLARRAEAPHAGQWAIPGGVLRVDLDASLDAAAHRVAQERTGLDLPTLLQHGAVGGPTRDPRAPWALSVVYRALAPLGSLPALTANPTWQPRPGKRVEALAWRPVDEAAADPELAFDHAELVGQAAARTRQDVEALNWPTGFLPAEFTLGELQSIGEAVLGHRIDKSSFRRKLADRGLVVPVEGVWRGGANRPAQVYRLVG